MQTLAVILALNGAAVLTVALFAGLFLHRALLNQEDGHGWHLLHAGGSGRGVMLLALAATIHLPALPFWLTSVFAWLIILFAWTSTVAMILVAVTGEHGFEWSGPPVNKTTYALYVIGGVAVFPAFFGLIFGLIAAL